MSERRHDRDRRRHGPDVTNLASDAIVVLVERIGYGRGTLLLQMRDGEQQALDVPILNIVDSDGDTLSIVLRNHHVWALYDVANALVEMLDDFDS